MNGDQQLQTEIIELRRDLRKVREDLRRHVKAHETEDAERTAGRRRLVTWGIAAVAAIDGPLVTLLLARGR